MKHYFKKLNVFLYICLAFFAYSCTYEKEFVNEENHLKIKMEQKSFDELLQLPAFNEAYRKVIKSKTVLSNEIMARTALEEQYGFDIVDTKVQVMAEDGLTSYTMLIERAVSNELEFENLIIQIDSLNNVSAGLLKYNIQYPVLTKEDYYSNFVITDKELIPLEIDGKMSFEDCVTTVTLMCNQCWGDAGHSCNNHPATIACMTTSFGVTFLSVQYGISCLTTTINTSGSVSLSNSTSTSGGGISSSGTILSNPIPNCRECIEEDNLVDDTCEELKKILQTPTSLPVGAISIKAAIEDLRDKYTMTEHEEGYSFYFNSTNNQMYALPAEQLTNYSVRYRKSPAVFGGAHFHQDGLVPMFSHDDVPTLLNLYNQSQTALNQENPNFPISTHLLVSELGVYAIIPDNPTLFNSTISSIYADEVKRDKFRKKLESMYNRLFSPFNQTWSDDTDDYLKILLKFMTNIDSDNNYSLGLSLYRGKYDANGNINGWEKLTIQKKPNTVNDYEIIKSNCN
jgi:hypothetical protein